MSSYSSTDIFMGMSSPTQDAVVRRSASQAASVLESEEENDASESRGPPLWVLVVVVCVASEDKKGWTMAVSVPS